MFQRILVPLDGTTRAEQALPVALRLARASAGSLLLLRVVSTATDFWPFMPDAEMVRTAIESRRDDAQCYLDRVVATLSAPDIEIETMVEPGPAAPTILAEATSLQADLIVMCSQGATSLSRFMMRSVTREVERHSPVPVLVLREGGPLAAGAARDLERPLRVLVPLDGSAHAKAALIPATLLAIALAAPLSPTIHLTRIVKPVPDHDDQDQDYLDMTRRLQRAKEYLERTIERLRAGWSVPEIRNVAPNITWSVVPDADVAEGILRVAETGEDVQGSGPCGGCDVVAIATHGYSGLSLLRIGSTTERILNISKLPLLIVRPSTMDVAEKHQSWVKKVVEAIPV